ncbi:protein odr-4 homolog [Synchiropus picturatus]
MGRGYIVEEAVEAYLSQLCGLTTGPVTGLLVGQSTVQRDFVVLASRTPQRDDSTPATLDSLDKEWITEHARQVSRMLPGGLHILGVFIITEGDAKDIQTSLRQLLHAVENLVSSEHLWSPADDDVTERIMLHVNRKTRKIVCKTFDVKDPKSMAKPADWKYQSGVCSSWSMVSCCLHVDLAVPLPDNSSDIEVLDTCLKGSLKAWAQQIEAGVVLFDGVKLLEDAEFMAGQKRNARQNYSAQLLIKPVDQRRSTDVTQPCGGSLSLSGTIHSRAYVHNNKPKGNLVEKLLKRDLVSTLVTRVRMLVEELLASEELSRGDTEQLCLPQRVFTPINTSGPLSVCDYQFSGEDTTELTERLKEMLDIDVTGEDFDTSQEMAQVTLRTHTQELEEESASGQEQQKNNYFGVAMASVIALLATAISVLYLNDV